MSPTPDNPWDLRLGSGGEPELREGSVLVRIGRYSTYGLELKGVPNKRAAQGEPGVVRVVVWNVQTGKVRFSFILHAWWLRVFVFDLAKGAALIEKEFETLPQAYVDRMENDQDQDGD